MSAFDLVRHRVDWAQFGALEGVLLLAGAMAARFLGLRRSVALGPALALFAFVVWRVTRGGAAPRGGGGGRGGGLGGVREPRRPVPSGGSASARLAPSD